MLKPSNVSLTLDEAVLALQDFFERFHTNIFNCHASTIAEFLNEIRWGVYEYLLPEYRRSYTLDAGDPPGYSFSYPTGLHWAARGLRQDAILGLDERHSQKTDR